MGEGSQGAHRARRQAMLRKVHQRHIRFYARCGHWPLAGESPNQPIRWHREHWILAAMVAAMVLLSAVAIPSWANAMKRTAPSVRTSMALPLPALPPAPAQEQGERWKDVTVRPGQTLSTIFQAQGLDFADVQRTMDAATDNSILRNLHPGDVLAFRLGSAGQLEALRFDSDDLHRVTLDFTGASVQRLVHERSFSVREHVAHGVIEHSLSASAAKAGLSNAVMVQLAHVFRHKIDFRRNIRAGDRFTVVYNAIYRDGEYLHAGKVLAAEFYNRGHRYTAYRYELPDGHVGYYTQDGRPLSVSLLRTPVKYTRISSPFGRRVDPVLHKRHLHTGVDLAAAKGTPIHAASRGVITTHRWVRGYGRYVCVKLNATYTTCYAHMSAYVKGQGRGTHVQQGEVIGYVGMTGYATGPHLHFEVRIHGRPVNPMTVTMPKPKPLAPKLMAGFRQQTKPLLARIQRLDENLQLAKARSGAKGGDASDAG